MYLLGMKYLEALPTLAQGKNSTIFLPAEAAGVMGAIGGLRELVSRSAAPTLHTQVDAPGTLEVSCADLLEATNLAEYLAGPSHSIKTWKPVGQPEALQVSNHEAKRFTFRTGDMMKEIVTCRRGERVFFFYGLYSAKDPKSRDQLRQCVGSVVWEK